MSPKRTTTGTINHIMVIRATRILRVVGSYYAAFVLSYCLLVAIGSGGAQDVSSNEVVPVRTSAPQAVTLKSTTRKSPSKGSSNATSSSSTNASSRVVVCPLDTANAFTRILSVSCERNADCNFLGADHRCCKKICRRAVDAPINEPPHEDFLGFRRRCPVYAFPERLPVKRCAKDEDCEGVNRICCPDKKDSKLYCRTAAPVWSALPFPENHETLKSLAGFLQCQSAPPAVIDIFARPCNKTMDCLPNLCCQEGSNKVCRPPKRSLLGLAAQATSRFVKG